MKKLTDPTEKSILNTLHALKNDKKYIALSLHPPSGAKTIQMDGNRLFINEGRNGIFENVKESFYDFCVTGFDSRTI